MSNHAVVWSVTAQHDLEQIAAFIADDNPVNALRVVERLEARAESLYRLPMRGRVVPELRWHGITSFLELIERPWRIIYRVDGAQVLVVGVLDGRRNLDDLLLDRLVR